MRGTRLWLLMGVIALLVSAFAVAGCGGDDDDDDGGDTTTAASGEDLGLISEGTLTVGTDTPFPPFEIGQPPNISGYDIEVMNAIAENLGLTPEYTDTGFGTIFRDTANGQFDTPRRRRRSPRGARTRSTSPIPTTRRRHCSSPRTRTSPRSMTSGTIVGAQDGTTGETYANDETDASEVRGFPEGPNAVSALVTGQVEAVIIDQPVAVDAVEKQGGVEIVQEIATNELYGYAVAPDNDALREAMNEALATIKEDGTLDDLYEQYFQTAPPESVQGENPLLTND